MAKRKTQYTINFTADQQLVNNTILSWLGKNQFQLMQKDGYTYYRSGMGLIGAFRCFEYYIQGNQLIILAYLRSPKKPFPLDNGMVGVVQTAPYVSLIEDLTRTISSLGLNQQMQYQQNMYQQQQMQYNQSAYQPQMQYNQNPYQQHQSLNSVQTYDKNGNVISTSFEEQNAKRQGKCATWSFWMGLASVLIGFMGMAFGWFVIIVTYYLAAIGLKSPKRNVAILAMILTTVGTVIAFLTMGGILPAIV